MNRRGFLSSLIAGGMTATLDPERLLWTPGKRLISIPRPTPLIFYFSHGFLWEWTCKDNIWYLTDANKDYRLALKQALRSVPPVIENAQAPKNYLVHFPDGSYTCLDAKDLETY